VWGRGGGAGWGGVGGGGGGGHLRGHLNEDTGRAPHGSAEAVAATVESIYIREHTCTHTHT